MREEFDDSIYAKYASVKDPQTLQKNGYLTHTERTLTIEEPFPKAYIHLLLMPRVGAPPFTTQKLENLRTLLTSPEVSKQEAHNLLLAMKADAEIAVEISKQEMLRTKKCTWDIWVGFHAAPSLKYVASSGSRCLYLEL